MQYVVLIYNDGAMLDAMPPAQYDETMRSCLGKADELRREGRLLDSRMLEEPSRARSIRVRNGRRTIVDGPFAETKEFLGGFNLIEAESIDEALEIAMQFPWASSGCVEVRPVRDIEVVRARVERAAAAAG